MRKGLERALLDAVRPHLVPGEQLTMSTHAVFGSNHMSSTIRHGYRTPDARSASFELSVPKRYFLVLTSHRLLVLNSTDAGKPLPSVYSALPRHGLRMMPTDGGMYKAFLLIGPSGAPIGRVNFAVPQRKEGTRLADTLNATAG